MFNIVATTITTTAQVLPKMCFKCRTYPSELIYPQHSFSLIYAIVSLSKFVHLSEEMEMQKEDKTITESRQTQTQSQVSRHINGRTFQSLNA